MTDENKIEKIEKRKKRQEPKGKHYNLGEDKRAFTGGVKLLCSLLVGSYSKI
jgi:hypothetical protein